MIKTAKAFAYKAHQKQLYGSQPYTVHLEDVAKLAAPYGDIAIVVAYLHDVVEDTGVKLYDIEKEFGTAVAECVKLLTDEPGINRKERKAKTYAKMAVSNNEIALIVKACDRLANLRSCQANNSSLLQMYQKERAAFKQAVFREGLCDSIWQEIELILGSQSLRIRN